VAVDDMGTRMASGDADGTVFVRSLPSGDVINTIRYKATLPVFSGDENLAAPGQHAVTGIAFSRDGKRLAVATEAGAILVWPSDVAASKPWRIDSFNRIHSLAFDPSGQFIAYGTDDGISIMGTQDETWTVQEHLDAGKVPVRSVAFWPDGPYLISGGDDQLVRIWDASGVTDSNLLADYPRGDNRFIKALVGQRGTVTSLAVSDRLDLFASGARDGAIIVRSLPKDLRATKPAEPPAEELALEDTAPAPPITSVYVAFGPLSKSQADAVGDELRKSICGHGTISCFVSLQGDREDGGVSYLNSAPVERKVAEEILARLKDRGISGEIRE